MKEFLERNEGLRSRIAFHIDFPDYDPGELMQILRLMADQKGLSLEAGVEEKCMEVFKRTAKQKDYGNGRFGRNLLEQAMLAQSNRWTAFGAMTRMSLPIPLMLWAACLSWMNLMPSLMRGQWS